MTDPNDISWYSDFLINTGNIEIAKPYLLELQNNEAYLNTSGKYLVRGYLKLNDVETSARIAKTMSDEDDNYDQQDALMLVADRYISDGKNDSALEIINFAYRKAQKVGEENPAYASIGASPLTRKIIYLREIRERLFNLKRFAKGLDVVNSLKIRDDHFQEFYAESLVEFVKRQTKTLPRKGIYTLLEFAQKIFDEDEDYNLMEIRIKIAEIYTQMGEKTKAVELLAKILDEAKENSYREDDILLSAGKVFEQNKLKADANLKKILKAYIEDAE